MSKDVKGCWIALLTLPVLVVISAVFNGFALSVMWSWFVVPVFHIPGLSVAYAIGLAMVVGFLLPRQIKEDDKKKSLTDQIITAAVSVFLTPAIALAGAFIVHLFV